MEWKYRGADLFSFRNKKLTFDLWDFSGDPDYHCIYACFNCANSLHLIVWDARRDRKELVRWLSDIQSTSVQRIPVIVVFTHMDTFKLREQKDEFRRRIIQWLDYHNSRFDSTNGAFSLMSSMSQTVRTLHGEEVLSSYEPPPEAFKVQDVCSDTIPLMPLVIKAHFVSNMTGDGLPKLRKTLYKAATGSLSQEILNFPGFQMIGQEVPAVYTNVEFLIRQLRSTFRTSLKEGEQKAFYSISELMDKLQRPLKELNIEEKDFTAALVLMHEVCRLIFLPISPLFLHLLSSLLTLLFLLPSLSSLLCPLSLSSLLLCFSPLLPPPFSLSPPLSPPLSTFLSPSSTFFSSSYFLSFLVSAPTPLSPSLPSLILSLHSLQTAWLHLPVQEPDRQYHPHYGGYRPTTGGVPAPEDDTSRTSQAGGSQTQLCPPQLPHLHALGVGANLVPRPGHQRRFLAPFHQLPLSS